MSVFTFTRNGLTEVIVFDATTSESHTQDADVTENPVETGSAITDNVRAKPAQLKLETLVTDYPVGLSGGGTGAPAEEGRAQGVYDLLIALKNEGVRIEVSTGAKLYRDMVIQSITLPRDKALSGALRFSILLKEIKTVSSQTVEANLSATERKAQPKKKEGDKTARDATDAERKRSVLQSITAGAADFSVNGMKKFWSGGTP
jgi:hypothetical protein